MQSLEASDGRLTSHQRALDGAVSLLCRLHPMRFLLHTGRLNNDGRAVLDPDPVIAVGLVAQEVSQVVPEAVYHPVDDSREFWMIDYEQFVPILVRSIQEQQSDIQSQATRIHNLESKVSELEAEMVKLKEISKVIDQATRAAFAQLRNEVSALGSRVSSAESKTSCSCSK